MWSLPSTAPPAYWRSSSPSSLIMPGRWCGPASACGRCRSPHGCGADCRGAHHQHTPVHTHAHVATWSGGWWPPPTLYAAAALLAWHTLKLVGQGLQPHRHAVPAPPPPRFAAPPPWPFQKEVKKSPNCSFPNLQIVYLIIIGDVLVGVPPDFNGLITNLLGIHDPSGGREGRHRGRAGSALPKGMQRAGAAEKGAVVLVWGRGAWRG